MVLPADEIPLSCAHGIFKQDLDPAGHSYGAMAFHCFSTVGLAHVVQVVCSSSTVQYYAVYLPWSVNQYFRPCRICQVSHGITINTPPDVAASMAYLNKILTLPDIAMVPWHSHCFSTVGQYLT